MNFDGNFSKIGDADVSILKDLVYQLTAEHWCGDQTRQNRYEAHRDTESIGLVYDEDFRHIDPTELPPMQLFAPALRLILAKTANHFESQPAATNLLGQPIRGYFVRANLVRLKSGGEISSHQDMNFSLAHSHRVHVPVITNANVLFTVGDATANLQEGEIVEINNRRMHSVRNDGSSDRVHLILDWVTPNEPCCCSSRAHPGVPCSPEACLDTDRLRIPCLCYPH